jgi:DNA-binding transcriptional regulator YiaG
MPNFASLIKSEIARLAKKESRSETQALKKASASYRSDIAALKRRISALESALARQSKLVVKSAGKAAATAEDGDGRSGLRFQAKGFASLRKKLGISAKEMAQLLDVSMLSVYKWETGKTMPRASQLPAIAEVRKLGKRGAVKRLEELNGAAAEKPARKRRARKAKVEAPAAE